MNVLAVCGFLLAVLCIQVLLRRLCPEFTPLTLGASAILLTVYLLREGMDALLSLWSAAAGMGLLSHLELLIKALAVSVACNLTSSVCRDCGESSLAEKAELAGKIAILSLSVPLAVQLLSLL